MLVRSTAAVVPQKPHCENETTLFENRPTTSGLEHINENGLKRDSGRQSARKISGQFSKAKMRFQSFFMLMTVQPFFVASSYNAWVKVPTLVSGSPWAGPYAYSRFASSWSTNIASRGPSPALVYSSSGRSPGELPNAAD